MQLKKHVRLVRLVVIGLVATTVLAACERTVTVQRGYRGTSSWQIYKQSALQSSAELNQIPAAEDPADEDTPPVNEVFKNVQVLNDISSGEFSRLMQALTTWVAPEEGCEFCHNPKKLESDEKYTKVVARRMLQMTRDINSNWKTHVGGTGVTCWTCHRGQAVPTGDWFASPAPTPSRMHTQAAFPRQNFPAPNAGNSSLPYDPLSTFLTTGNEVRVQGTSPLRTHAGSSIKSAESTYALMMYISQSLGVNCNFCHNTRAMGRWEESTPQRSTAWHGIRMVRDLNVSYLIPLQPNFPVERLSVEGDGPKVGCATCHKGSYKPLFGLSPLKDYPVLAGVVSPADAEVPSGLAPGTRPAPAPAPVPQSAPAAESAKVTHDADAPRPTLAQAAGSTEER